MQKWLLIALLLFITGECGAQKGFLFVKRRYHKVKTFREGDYIRLELGGGRPEGYITLLHNDSIYLNGLPYAINLITKIIIHPKIKQPLTGKELLLITAGVGLSTAGMTASKWEPFNQALLNSAVIGFGPLILQRLLKIIPFKRRAYRIGKKFRLQVLDLHLAPLPKRSF
jgi:hypothetical protein